jgi:hypothetical protein
MATTVRLNSTAYALGALVIPASQAPVTSQSPTNPGFESGNSGWTIGTGWAINNGGQAYEGSWRGIKTSGASSDIVNNNKVAVAPGQFVSASILCATGGATADAQLGLRWRTSANALISDTLSPNAGNSLLVWRSLTASGAAPANAAFMEIFVKGTTGSGESVIIDNATWTYAALAVPSAFLYECIVAGTSGTSEPIWPTVLGGTVVDGTVTWQAIAAIRITWTAKPIMKSGATEPVWPTSPGGMVSNGNMSFKAVTRRIEDTRCPNSKQVAIIASKVWSADDDVVGFCAVNNARDWTTPDDAGFLPTGLQQGGSVITAVLNTYRSNLVNFSSSTFSMWGVDPDPAANAIIDTMEGIGSIYQFAAQPVANDLFFLTALGVRTVGIAVGADNLASGDVGMPIDELIQDAVAAGVTSGYTPRGLYYPAAGQYWLAIGPQVFVYTMNQAGAAGAWSRYVFPHTIDAHAQLDNDLYIRDGSTVWKMTDTVNYDETPTGSPPYPKTYYDSVIQWPAIDSGGVGQTSMMVGFDIVGTGTPTVQFGFDQLDFSVMTAPYVVPADTLTGYPISMPLSAPTIIPKITYTGAAGNFWSLQLLNLYWAQ